MKKLTIAITAVALIGTPALAAPPLPAPVYSWTGFYAGLNVGWGWGGQDTTANFPGPEVSRANVTIVGSASIPVQNAPIAFQESTNPTGVIGGVQAGYNWQSIANLIFGVEADFQGSGESASGNTYQNARQLAHLGIANPPGPPAETFVNTSQSISQSVALSWFGTVRGRVGHTVSPTVMLYGTGGLAYGRLNQSVAASYDLSATCAAPCSGTATLANGTVVPLPFTGNQILRSSTTRTGWTIGGGIEGAVPNTRVTWKAEYLYVDLGTADYRFSGSGLGTIAVSTRFTTNIVRVGLNYQFH